MKITLGFIAMFGLVQCAPRRGSARIRQTTTPSPERDPICTEKNAYYPDAEQCDVYVECQNWKAKLILCPEGLRFKPGTQFLTFPCVYPTDVSCVGRPKLQMPKPTPDCPHLYGFFHLNNSTNCGLYRSCVEGRPLDVRCPEGLAYNIQNNQCDWPDVVKGCDVESYLNFVCPGLFSNDSSAMPAFYAHPKSCQKYYVCNKGKPRLLSCGKDQVFDEVTGHCEDSLDVHCDRSEESET